VIQPTRITTNCKFDKSWWVLASPSYKANIFDEHRAAWLGGTQAFSIIKNMLCWQGSPTKKISNFPHFHLESANRHQKTSPFWHFSYQNGQNLRFFLVGSEFFWSLAPEWEPVSSQKLLLLKVNFDIWKCFQ